MDVFWHRVLNLPNQLPRWERPVISIPITDSQAAVISPDFVADIDRMWADDDE